MKFTVDIVKELHQMIADKTGGGIGIRDESLLESAVESIYQSFDGKDLYPTSEEKAARLGYGLISNHAFLDGNKRIGILCMLTFLALEGYELQCTDEDIVYAGMNLASGSMKYDELLLWIKTKVCRK